MVSGTAGARVDAAAAAGGGDTSTSQHRQRTIVHVTPLQIREPVLQDVHPQVGVKHAREPRVAANEGALHHQSLGHVKAEHAAHGLLLQLPVTLLALMTRQPTCKAGGRG